MAYEKTVWKDQEVENPRTYSVRQNLDDTITLYDAFGSITELGTPVNAENMNKIEQGIADAQLISNLEQSLSQSTTKYPSSKAVQDAVNNISNSKANTDLSNINASGKSVISTQGKPSSRSDSLTIGPDNTPYTAPDNGWYDFEAFATAAQGVITIVNTTNGMSTTVTAGSGGNPYLRCYIPAKKSDTVVIQYANVNILDGKGVLKFIYDEGVK